MCALHFSLYPSTEYGCGVSCGRRPLPVVNSGVGSIGLASAIFGVPSGGRWSALRTPEPSRGQRSNVSFGVTAVAMSALVSLR